MKLWTNSDGRTHAHKQTCIHAPTYARYLNESFKWPLRKFFQTIALGSKLALSRGTKLKDIGHLLKSSPKLQDQGILNIARSLI